MKNLSAKFNTILLSGSVALLTACHQPTTTEPNTKSPSAQSSDTHAGHDMDKMANVTSASTTSQPAHSTEYSQAMSVMHDKMSLASQINNPDISFATGMMAHHQGAVEMAKIQLKYGKDRQMRALAENIINAQQREISQLQTWLETHKNDNPSATNASTNMKNMDMKSMDMKNHDAMMQGMMANDPDVAFAKGMIPHHQGAIDMANSELKMGKDKQMLDLAKRIKAAQDPEIKQMQTWLESKKTN